MCFMLLSFSVLAISFNSLHTLRIPHKTFILLCLFYFIFWLNLWVYMAAQLPLPRLSGRLPEQPATEELTQTVIQPDISHNQELPLDPNHNHNISTVSAAAQEQRDMRLLVSLFNKKLRWYKFVHCDQRDIGREISPEQRKNAWRRICDLHLNLRDERDIATYCMDPNGLNWVTFKQDEEWWSTWDYAIEMRESGYAPLSDGEAERQNRRSRRYEDKSVRFRSNTSSRSRSRTRNYGSERRSDYGADRNNDIRDNRLDNNEVDNGDFDAERKQQVKIWVDILCFLVIIFILFILLRWTIITDLRLDMLEWKMKTFFSKFCTFHVACTQRCHLYNSLQTNMLHWFAH